MCRRSLDFFIYYSFYKIYSFKRLNSTSSNLDKFSNKYKNEYDLTEEQREAIIGIILGDGSPSLRDRKRKIYIQH